jgi:HPt (histidine-containing phosphotransfer) domain-containing protein
MNSSSEPSVFRGYYEPAASSIDEWLTGINLSRHIAKFAEMQVSELPMLTEERLQSIGIDIRGHRVRILNACRALETAPVATPAEQSVAEAAPTEQRVEAQAEEGASLTAESVAACNEERSSETSVWPSSSSRSNEAGASQSPAQTSNSSQTPGATTVNTSRPSSTGTPCLSFDADSMGTDPSALVSDLPSAVQFDESFASQASTYTSSPLSEASRARDGSSLGAELGDDRLTDRDTFLSVLQRIDRSVFDPQDILDSTCAGLPELIRPVMRRCTAHANEMPAAEAALQGHDLVQLRHQVHTIKAQLGWLHAHAAQQAASVLERAAAAAIDAREVWSDELGTRLGEMLAELHAHVGHVERNRQEVLLQTPLLVAAARRAATSRAGVRRATRPGTWTGIPAE